MSLRLIALILLAMAGPALAQTATGADTVQQAADTAAQTVETEANTVQQSAEQSMDAALDAATDAAVKVKDTANQATGAVDNAADTASSAAESASETAVEKVEDAAEAAAADVEQAAEKSVDAAEDAAETAMGAAEQTTEAAVGDVEAVAEKAVDAAGDTAEAAKEVVEEVADDAVKADEAAMNPRATAEEETAGEPVAKEEPVADAGIEAKVAACAACHGADGNSVIPDNPKLAGQVPGYIASQMAMFKSGERENAIMAAQVANLTDEDMKALDDYFSTQTPQLGAISEEMLPLADSGEKIYRGGQIELSISACMSCHGPNGDGIPIRFPRVSGQHMQYLETQLLAFKTGARVNDIMNPIAFRLSEQQIKALAAYMHALK